MNGKTFLIFILLIELLVEKHLLELKHLLISKGVSFSFVEIGEDKMVKLSDFRFKLKYD